MKRYAVCLLPLALFLGLYLATLSGVHTYDALSYILDVDRKPWPELFHPHHLAYGPFGFLIRAGAVALGWQGSAAPLLQGANAVAGALGAALFAAVVLRATGRRDLALLGALLLGSSYAYWYYAVEIEVYTIAALFLITSLGLMLELSRRPSLAIAAGLGVSQGLAVLFHQTNVLLSVPALAALLWAPWQGHSAKAQRRIVPIAVAYLLPLGLIVGGAYLWVGLGVSGFRTWGELYGWAAGYTTTGWWGGAIDGDKWAGLIKGLSETLARPGGGLIGLGLLLALLPGLRRLAAIPRPALAVPLSWLLVYGGFFLWWEPDNSEFWIASLPPFYLLLLWAAGGRQGTEGWGRRLLPAGLAGLGLVMLGLNLASIEQRGDPARDLQRRITEALAARSAPGDLLVVPDGLQELYLPYYAERVNVAALSQAMNSAGDWSGACAELQRRVDMALESGFAVLLAEEAMRPTPAPPGEPPTMAERFGLDAATVGACYEPFAAAMEPIELGPGLPAYARIAAAQELADGPGWDFTRGRWGWRASNAELVDTPGPGWTLRPGVDPALTSPPLQLEAGHYSAIELRMAAGTTARDGQIFFLDGAGQADEARSLRFELRPGSEPQIYRLELDEAAGWQGTLGGLRLDPVGAGDGGTVMVEWIRFLP